MVINICTIDGIVQEDCFTSLKGCCEHFGVSYASATKGKTSWLKKGKVIVITESHLFKITGRGRKKSFGSGIYYEDFNKPL